MMAKPLVNDGRKTGQTQAQDGEAWVDRLSILVLTIMLLYAIIGIPELNRDAAQLATDYVNPLNRVIWLALLGLASPVAFMRWRQAVALMLASWPLLLLYAYFALSVVWALDPDTSMRRLLFTVVQLILSVILLSGIRRAGTLHLVIAGVCAFGAFADLVSWVVAPGYAMTDEGLAGLQLQKNQTGLIMMYGCLSAATAYFLAPGKFQRYAIVGATVMMAGLLVATKSTTSQSIVLMAPVVMPIVLVVARLRKPVIWAIVSLIPLTILGLLLCYLAWCGITNADPWLPTRGMTFTGRTDLWSFTLGEIAKRPWFGAGYSSFWAIDPTVQPSLKSDQWFGVYTIINEAHDGYLDLIATTGIFGLIAGLLVVFRTIGIGGQAIARTEPAAVSWETGRMGYPTAVFHLTMLIGLLVHNFTESNLFSNNSVLAVAFTLTALDLEKWRIATRRPRAMPFPYPEPLMPRPARVDAGAIAARTP
jgi:O-antigen ligase